VTGHDRKKPASGDGPDESLPPFDESDTHVDVPSLTTARRTAPPSTFGPSIVRSSPSGERPKPPPPRSDPTMPRIAAPRASRPWLTAAFAVGVGAAVGLGLVAVVARQETPADAASSQPPPIAAAVAGGVVEVAPAGPGRGSLVLDVTPQGAATVRVSSSSWETSWTGRERTIELRGLAAGEYTTQLTPAGGATIRDRVEVRAETTCRYSVDVARAGGRWTNEGCR
jgi:hypothetical protein